MIYGVTTIQEAYLNWDVLFKMCKRADKDMSATGIKKVFWILNHQSQTLLPDTEKSHLL